MVQDIDLQHDVMAELEWEPSLDAANIGVSCDSGVVTLSGHVGSYAEKQAAERAARRVKGVKAIAQEIEVRLPHEKKTGDDEIAKRAARILDWNVALPRERIAIKVERGIVTLSGEVDWYYQRLTAERDVEKLSGVVAVVNAITVRPHISPLDVRTKIEAALRRNAELESGSITVAIEGGKVILGGRVKASYEREIAEHAAWSAPGVTAVEDRIALG